jgi:hypothetical protein
VFPRPSPIDVTIPTDSREECSQNVAEWNDTVTVQKVFHKYYKALLMHGKLQDKLKNYLAGLPICGHIY